MQTYDYIVVGAGSAGAAVANRLSADPRNKVLLLEAGRASHPWSSIPVGMARLIKNPAANWLYSSEPEASTNGRRLPVPRGKLLGGSSSINGMVFVRGQAQDFDTWAQLGNRGWSYQDVLPFFKRMESYAGGGEDALRGRARSRGQRRYDQLAATLGAVRHRPARAPAQSRHRGAPRAARRRREPARPLRAAHALADRQEGHHLQRPGTRPRSRASGVALRALPQGHARHGGSAAARLCLFARGPRSAGPDARLDPDADRTRTQRPEDLPPVRRDLVRPPDASGKQGTHPHHRGRS